MPFIDQALLSQKIHDKKQKLIAETMASIGSKGLCSVKHVRNQCVTSITQVQEEEGTICVNSLDLREITDNERRIILRMAVDEEFCGIFGISLERQWTFQHRDNSELRNKEIAERLSSSMVFILQPPKNDEVILKEAELDWDTGKVNIPPSMRIKFYTNRKEDGISANRARNRFLTDEGLQVPSSGRILEIKTEHIFPMSEVLAVLVPEHLVSLAKQHFPHLHINPVPQKLKNFIHLPMMMDLLHQEKIGGSLAVEAPDYYSVLDRWLTEKSITEFSLHCVRLATSFDMDVRPIASMNESLDLLNITHAQVVNSYPDGSGWALFHRRYSFNLSDSLNDAFIRTSIYGHLIEKIKKNCTPLIELQKKIVLARGDLSLQLLKNISLLKFNLLSQLGIRLIAHPRILAHYYVVVDAKQLTHVKRIIESSEKKEAMKTISAVTQGFWCRKRVYEVHLANQHVSEAQKILAGAQETLANTQQRLPSYS